MLEGRRRPNPPRPRAAGARGTGAPTPGARNASPMTFKYCPYSLPFPTTPQLARRARPRARPGAAWLSLGFDTVAAVCPVVKAKPPPNVTPWLDHLCRGCAGDPWREPLARPRPLRPLRARRGAGAAQGREARPSAARPLAPAGARARPLCGPRTPQVVLDSFPGGGRPPCASKAAPLAPSFVGRPAARGPKGASQSATPAAARPGLRAVCPPAPPAGARAPVVFARVFVNVARRPQSAVKSGRRERPIANGSICPLPWRRKTVAAALLRAGRRAAHPLPGSRAPPHAYTRLHRTAPWAPPAFTHSR
ncbi:MAG: hypothetical protein J3K34DRAFT_410549 [Monoraphidium minutum]|nr:MAG: hypothetical protein J3K34DRAFT_410549 [Monoraphidium minutum]